jgi:hypothetical protein
MADALAQGIGKEPETLDAALSACQTAFREKTMPIFDYTVKAAGLKEPASAMPIYARIAQSADETVRFMDVLAGNIPAKDIFNPQNIARLLET